jgi:hypothetical protein
VLAGCKICRCIGACPEVVLARTVIELNITYYRELLERETDGSKRQTIVKLLAEEEPKLAKLLADKSDEK